MGVVQVEAVRQKPEEDEVDILLTNTTAADAVHADTHRWELPLWEATSEGSLAEWRNAAMGTNAMADTLQTMVLLREMSSLGPLPAPIAVTQMTAVDVLQVMVPLG